MASSRFPELICPRASGCGHWTAGSTPASLLSSKTSLPSLLSSKPWPACEDSSPKRYSRQGKFRSRAPPDCDLTIRLRKIVHLSSPDLVFGQGAGSSAQEFDPALKPVSSQGQSMVDESSKYHPKALKGDKVVVLDVSGAGICALNGRYFPDWSRKDIPSKDYSAKGYPIWCQKGGGDYRCEMIDIEGKYFRWRLCTGEYSESTFDDIHEADAVELRTGPNCRYPKFAELPPGSNWRPCKRDHDPFPVPTIQLLEVCMKCFGATSTEVDCEKCGGHGKGLLFGNCKMCKGKGTIKCSLCSS